MRIHLRPEAGEAEGITLQTTCQQSERDHQQQPIDPLRIALAAVFQLEHTGFLITEQLLAAEVRWTGFSGQAPALVSEAGYRP